MLNDDDRKELVFYRIEKSYKVLDEARDNAKLGHWNLTANRLYYSVFHMCQALLLSNGDTPRRHAGMIHKIGQDYVLEGKLDKSFGRLISRLYELRQSGDYDDKFDATEDEIMPYFEQVELLLDKIKALIKT
jgi:uncharacterized protein (UPF0332 family)